MSYSRNGQGSSPYRCFVRDAEWKLYADGSLYHVPEDWLEKNPVTGEKGEVARNRLQPILDRILESAPEGHINRDPKKKKRKKQ